MTEQPTNWQEISSQATEQALRERDRLIGEIVMLLPVVARRPGCMKLLHGILQQCQAFSQYKANRRYQ